MQGGVLEPSGHVDEDVASRQPSLAGAVDVRVSDVPEPDVAADVDVPGAQVGVDVVVVTVRLERHPQRGCGSALGTGRGARLGVEDSDVGPVPAPVRQLEPGHSLHDRLARLEVGPANLAELLAVLVEGDGGRRERGHLDVRAAVRPGGPSRRRALRPRTVTAARRSPHPGPPRRQVVIGTSVDADHDRPAGSTHERVLLGPAQGNGPDGEGLAPGYQLDGVEC